MSRDQRISDNWALIYAQEQALKYKEPLIVILCLQTEFLEATSKIFDFMVNGLNILQKEFKKYNIPFIILEQSPQKALREFIENYSIGQLITDFSPLKIKTEWIEAVKKEINIPFYEVDAHNIVPCWEASPKKEYAAYTLRPKIRKILTQFLDKFPKISRHKYTWNENFEENANKKWSYHPKIKSSENPAYSFNPGEDSAKRVLEEFLSIKFSKYNADRNNPNKDGTSNLSPYLHFGHLSAQRVVLEANKAKKIMNLKGTFYDEIIVRRELSDNFCYYNENYDKFEGFPPWARQTLNAHRNDIREYIYTSEEFENAQTHDNLWNAAQIEMKQTGKMHGYMRMYWAKKILEWTDTPEHALKIAIYLNNKYELDGRDPNGYVGAAWAIGGVHDRAWKERKIFGKIRYMSYNGMKRKFKIDEYIKKFIV